MPRPIVLRRARPSAGRGSSPRRNQGGPTREGRLAAAPKSAALAAAAPADSLQTARWSRSRGTADASQRPPPTLERVGRSSDNNVQRVRRFACEIVAVRASSICKIACKGGSPLVTVALNAVASSTRGGACQTVPMQENVEDHFRIYSPAACACTQSTSNWNGPSLPS